jgi:TRAP-type mannitol/chloroaromatic compound transport system permease small subunit
MAVHPLERFADFVELLIDRIGRTVAWLVLVVVFLLFLQNPLRELVGRGQFAANDMAQLAHAAVFMVGVAYAWRWDRQVRVDLFRARMPARMRAAVELLGTLLLLLPWLVIVAVDAVPTALESFGIAERFPESGTPGYFVLKSLLLAFVATMALQALAIVARSIAILAGVSRASR